MVKNFFRIFKKTFWKLMIKNNLHILFTLMSSFVVVYLVQGIHLSMHWSHNLKDKMQKIEMQMWGKLGVNMDSNGCCNRSWPWTSRISSWRLLSNEQWTLLEQYLGNHKPHDRKRWTIIALLYFLNAWIHKKQLGEKWRSRSIIAWSLINELWNYSQDCATFS